MAAQKQKIARLQKVNAHIRQAMNDKIIQYQDLYPKAQLFISSQAQPISQIPKLSKLDAQLLSDVNTSLANNKSSSRYSDMGNIYQILRAYRDMDYTSMSRQSRLLDGLRLMTRRAYLNKNARMINI